MKIQLLAIVLILSAGPAMAQEPTPFRWGSHEAIPARISDGLVTAQIIAAVVSDWRAPDRKQAFIHSGCSAAVAVLWSEGLKRLIHRDRPDHSDRKSTPSMHTGLTTALAGWKPAVGASFAVGVAWGRMGAGKHYGTDVLFGAGLGIMADKVCP